MKHSERLEKLRQKQQQLAATIREAEAGAAIHQRKRETRAKIIVGGVLLGSPKSEREALLSMLLPHMTERDRTFIGEFLTGGQPLDHDGSQIV